MFRLSQPGEADIRSFLAAERDQPYAYTEVGHSREGAPDGYNCDHNRIQLGTGADTFARAVTAVRQWKMFDLPWVRLCWPDAPIESGAAVAVLVSHLGFWSMNACRIVYVVEEHGTVEKFGFAYGTLIQHAERGEERFTVEYHSADQSVWYDLFAFSRPGALARLGYPITRRLQKRFAHDSKLAMRRAVEAR
jgi:uncharacterized protein (UPF0548 family)